MVWFRAHRLVGSRLALLALLLQMVLSFGHSHPSADAAAAGLAATPVEVTDSLLAASDQPAPSHDDHDDDGCAICATLAMAHSVLAAMPPALPLPQSGLAIERSAEPAALVAVRAAAAFQPRAPPAA
jgi:uncharacterized protein involved in copper resistance